MNSIRYFLLCTAVLFFCAGITALMIYQLGDLDDGIAAAAGLAIGYVNALIGYAIMAWGIRRSHNEFMASVFGSMILRFLLIFALLFVLIWALKLRELPLISTLVGSYFVYLGLEVVYLHLSTNAERKAK